MAVIDTSMDFPSNCHVCKNSRCQKSHIPWVTATKDYRTDRHSDCPLKSTDEMCNEIQNIYVGYRHGYEVMADVMDIINKYCKENT